MLGGGASSHVEDCVTSLGDQNEKLFKHIQDTTKAIEAFIKPKNTMIFYHGNKGKCATKEDMAHWVMMKRPSLW
jgi:hypothetical protein